MDIRDMEDFLVSLFDPQLTIAEKAELLRDHPVVSTWCLSEGPGTVVMSGIEVVFESGPAYRLILLPGGE